MKGTAKQMPVADLIIPDNDLNSALPGLLGYDLYHAVQKLFQLKWPLLQGYFPGFQLSHIQYIVDQFQ